MASSFTTNNDVEKPGLGEQSGVWGTALNLNFDKIDATVGKTLSKDMSSGNQTLSTSQTAVADFDSAVLRLTGTLNATRQVIFPASKMGVFKVDTYGLTFGANKIILKVTGETRGVTLVSATNRLVEMYSNGTSVRGGTTEVQTTYLLDEIKMYAPSGAFSSAALPFGWHVCNGGNGTVDLRGKFIRATSVVANLGDVGGAVTASVNINGNFTGSGNTGSTVLTEVQIPQHRHLMFSSFGSTNSDDATDLTAGANVAVIQLNGGDKEYSMKNAGGVAPSLGLTGNIGSGQGHTHTIGVTLSGTNPVVPTIPPYYKLIFIQFKNA